MKKVSPTKLRITALLAFAALAVPAYSQVVKKSEAIPVEPATQPADAPVEEEDLVVLSPFEVTAKTDVGYQATQTLAGTRIRTDLKDVGSAISVYTKEFMRDIGANDSSTLLQYTTNAEVGGTRGTYAGLGNGTSVDESSSLRSPAGAQRVRGLAAADNTRDFFVTDIPWDSYNVDRIDIQRGPNAILFGLGSPAGIVNASLRNAEFRNSGSVEAKTGSYGSTRASIDVNQQLVPGVLALRVDALRSDEKYQQKPAYQDDRRLSGALRFDPDLFNNKSFRTSVKLKFEHGDITANRPRNVTPNDSVTPWFKPLAANQASWDMGNGMGKTAVNNGYDSNRNDLANIVAGNGLGLQTRNTANPNYQPWLAAPVNQQQPFWLADGTSGQTYRVIGGYINPGARWVDGTTRGPGDGLLGKRYADQFFGLTSMNTYANNASLPLAASGQYRTSSLTDPTVFDFYNNLIDGPTKWESEKWDAYNIDFSQTAFDDRLGLQVTYDRQKYKRAGEAFLGNSPTITLDILKNFQDYYLTTSNSTGTTNPNYGRPYVTSTAGGTGSSYESDRKYLRGSIFGELRASDLLKDKFLVKLLGRQRFNGVYSAEKFSTEERQWNRLANTRDWAGYWNGNDGSSSSFTDRPPMAFVYLGSSIANRTTASGSYIPGITNQVTMADSNVYVFDSTWLNYSTTPSTAWTVPAKYTTRGSGSSAVVDPLGVVFDPSTFPSSTINGTQNVAQTQWNQASNPDNYVGWTYKPINLLRYDNGVDNSLLTKAAKSLRRTTSYAGSWQGFFWNDAFVPTLGWRYDEVKSKDKTAGSVSSNRSMLNLQPDVYRIADGYKPTEIVKSHSTSGGIVVHLNKLLPSDPLPFNVSLSYNKSDNFQVTSTRRNVYGATLSNPSGTTKDYGILLATKDNKYSFRAIKYETTVVNASSDLSDAAGIGRTIAQGLRFRNVFLYKLSGYDWSQRETPSARNTWGGTGQVADSSITAAEGRIREDSAINAWNDIQRYLTTKGFFQAWGFTPQDVSVLTDRTTYENAKTSPTAFDPAPQYLPPVASSVFGYSAAAPQGFTVTADTYSKGYEFELTANPMPNWRIAFNASQTEATRKNVGGPELAALIDFIDSKLYNPDGTPTWAGAMPQFGNTGLSINNNNYAPWRGGYTLMKIQEGALAPEIRKWRYNVISNYSFTKGFLKGVGVGASYRWQDKVVIGYPVVQTGNKYSFDLSKPYYGPADDALDLWFSYERKLTSKLGWKIQLNIRNVMKEEGVTPISVQPDGYTWATVRTKPVQEWNLTNTLTF